LRKRQFFRRKLAKIAENCDHNIDPWWSTSKLLEPRMELDVQLADGEVPLLAAGPRLDGANGLETI
jgi:hypothetical protein